MLWSGSPATRCRASALDHHRVASPCCCPCLVSQASACVAFDTAEEKAFLGFVQVAGLAVVKWLSVDVTFPYRLSSASLRFSLRVSPGLA